MKIQQIYTLQQKGYEAYGKKRLKTKIKKSESVPVHATKMHRWECKSHDHF